MKFVGVFIVLIIFYSSVSAQGAAFLINDDKHSNNGVKISNGDDTLLDNGTKTSNGVDESHLNGAKTGDDDDLSHEKGVKVGDGADELHVNSAKISDGDDMLHKNGVIDSNDSVTPHKSDTSIDKLQEALDGNTSATVSDTSSANVEQVDKLAKEELAATQSNSEKTEKDDDSIKEDLADLVQKLLEKQYETDEKKKDDPVDSSPTVDNDQDGVKDHNGHATKKKGSLKTKKPTQKKHLSMSTDDETVSHPEEPQHHSDSDHANGTNHSNNHVNHEAVTDGEHDGEGNSSNGTIAEEETGGKEDEHGKESGHTDHHDDEGVHVEEILINGSNTDNTNSKAHAEKTKKGSSTPNVTTEKAKGYEFIITENIIKLPEDAIGNLEPLNHQNCIVDVEKAKLVPVGDGEFVAILDHKFKCKPV